MATLSAAARQQIKEAGLTVTGYVRHFFPDGVWHGDTCGCTDDRCAGGFHHVGPDDCGCLPVLIGTVLQSSREG